MAATPAINQALHGYRSGHSLLAASLTLPPASQLIMLQRSDLSGPVVQSGFETYLTGYPLNELGAYVLARTWLAPEVERPGTVWTHSLLVSFSDLATIPDLSALAEMHRRPTAIDLVAYSLALPLPPAVPHRVPPLTEARRLIDGLYGAATSPLRLFARSAETYEAALLSAWSQQWPRLRRSFSFCTGVLSAGSASLRDFDVQVGPIGWTAPTADTPAQAQDSPWQMAAVQDAVAGGGELRKFFHEFGAESERGRADFAAIARVFLSSRSLSPTESPALVIAALRELGPAPGAFSRLKRAVLGPRTTARDELEMLCQLLRDGHGIVDFATIDIAGRARSLVGQNPHFGVEILRSALQSPDSMVAEQIVRDTAHALQHVPIELHAADFHIVLALVGLNSEYATAEWAIPTDALRQRQLLEALERSGPVSPLVARSVSRRLMATESPLADEAIAAVGAQAVYEVLDQTSSGGPCAVPSSWRDAVTRQGGFVKSWLLTQPLLGLDSALLIARTLKPNDIAAPSEARIWMDLAPKLDGSTSDILLAFLFLAAAGMGEEAGILMSERTFQPLHDRVISSGISTAAWSSLQRELPHLGLFTDWDMGEKVRRSLADRFVTNNWRPIGVLRVVHSPEVLEQVLGYFDSIDGGRDIIESLCSAVKQHLVDVPRAVDDILRDWCPKGRRRRRQ